MEGTPIAHLAFIATTAVQLAESRVTPQLPLQNGHSSASAFGGSEAAEAQAFVNDALSSVLQTALEGIADEGTSEDAAMAHVDAVQGIVRALDAVNSVIAEEREPAAATSTDSEIAEQTISQYRQKVWDALQSLASEPASTSAAATVRLHVLDLLSAIARPPGPAGPPRWGDWRPPAAAAGSGPDAQHSLLLSRSRALVEPLWPGQAGAMSPADLADVGAAKALFARLLDAADSPQQLAALAELLDDTWQDGAELAPAAPGTHDGGGDSGDSSDAVRDAAAVSAQAAQAEEHVGDASEPSGQDVCWVPAAREDCDPADEPALSALHACWAALLGAMVRRGQVAAVAKIIDAHAEQPRWLSVGEAHSLASDTYTSAGERSPALQQSAGRIMMQACFCAPTDCKPLLAANRPAADLHAPSRSCHHGHYGPLLT